MHRAMTGSLVVDKTLAGLGRGDKIALLAGDDNWHLAPLPAHHVPRVRTSGPLLARWIGSRLG